MSEIGGGAKAGLPPIAAQSKRSALSLILSISTTEEISLRVSSTSCWSPLISAATTGRDTSPVAGVAVPQAAGVVEVSSVGEAASVPTIPVTVFSATGVGSFSAVTSSLPDVVEGAGSSGLSDTVGGW